MTSRATRAGVLPAGQRVLLAVAVVVTLLGGAVLVLTALGLGHADVRGVRLTGALRLAFLAGLGMAVVGTGLGALGIVRRRSWAVALLAAVGPAFALVCLALDRLTPAPGAGRPLAFYVLGVGLAPALATWALGRQGKAGARRAT